MSRINFISSITSQSTTPISPPLMSRRSKVLVVDWDETITVKDTTLMVADVAYSRNRNLPHFSTYSKIYMNALAAYNMRCNADHDANRPLQQEIDYQKGLKDVELSSISALVQDGFFRNLTPADFSERASKVDLKPGFVEFAKRISQSKTPIYILSINWCKTMIEATLRLHGLQGCVVLANDFEVDEFGLTTGRFTKPEIRTGYDKMMELNRIRQMHPDTNIVYIGDSRGDILPMRVADTGVIIAGGRARSYFASVPPVKAIGSLQAGICEGDWVEIDLVW
ncbi:CIC11C00000000784 [Sungouiella intermedia]|uniref:CIC11C00000000784 n=1 Tax=Sungouiella intermedia TaxID=45354 RepID=A0A1L0BMS6_9ASCO|nr:CIC11C00000000784 [[Candida] intermedia]